MVCKRSDLLPKHGCRRPFRHVPTFGFQPTTEPKAYGQSSVVFELGFTEAISQGHDDCPPQ